jgi:FKBP-type peptidyl-prolyl cis-trans isomerase FkpA
MNKRQILILALSVLAFGFTSCNKDDGTANNCVNNTTGTPTSAELASLQAYLASKNITATLHSGGFYYVIHTQGTGVSPMQSSTVTVKYVGKLTNDVIFDQDQTGTKSFVLSSLILGWRRGLPLIQEGGSITLYIPPSLGYGCSAVGNIPPGSNLIFTIDLIDVI